ncbi:MAG: Clp protease N-terminal domain-containing protein, partial [Patescibacteria group bacterium]
MDSGTGRSDTHAGAVVSVIKFDMLFDQAPTPPILNCPACKSSGYIGIRSCLECRGRSFGSMRNGVFFYYGEPLTPYHIRLRQARPWLHNFELLGAVIFLFGFLALFIFQVVTLQLFPLVTQSYFWLGDRPETRPLWLALVALGFLLYRILTDKVTAVHLPMERSGDLSKELAHHEAITWAQVKNLPRRKRIRIDVFFVEPARRAMGKSFFIARSAKSDEVLPAHVFYALLASVGEVQGIFLRLGISPATLQARIAKTFTGTGSGRMSPAISEATQQALFLAYDLAVEAHQDVVDVTELLLATVRVSPPLQEILYDLNIDATKLANVIEWVRIRARLRRAYLKFRVSASYRSKDGMDRAMTAVATPFLNAFSQDTTLAAKFGHLQPCVARDKEIEEIFRIIEGGRQNVLLVGNSGVGKMSIIEGIAQRMVEERVPQKLRDKRLVQLSTSALLAGTTMSGAEDRLLRMIREIRRAGNVILFI